MEDAPPSVRIAATRETTEYMRARIGDVEFVVPGVSELLLRDRDGSELLNRSHFDQYHRFAGSASVSYGPAAGTATPAPPAPAAALPLSAGIGEDAAIGDRFTATTAMARIYRPHHRHAPGGQKMDGGIDPPRNGAAPDSAGKTRHEAHYFRFNTSLSEPWR